jgi:hypothetical protein
LGANTAPVATPRTPKAAADASSAEVDSTTPKLANAGTAASNPIVAGMAATDALTVIASTLPCGVNGRPHLRKTGAKMTKVSKALVT